MTGQFVVDEDVQAVIEFMQGKIATCKLVQVADALSQMARLLWGHYAQEGFRPIALVGHSLSSIVGETRPNATESGLAQAGAGGDFAEAMDVPAQ